MLAALLQQLDLLASLVAARDTEKIAELKSLAAQMNAVSDRLDRLKRLQTDRGDRKSPDLQS